MVLVFQFFTGHCAWTVDSVRQAGGKASFQELDREERALREAKRHPHRRGHRLSAHRLNAIRPPTPVLRRWRDRQRHRKRGVRAKRAAQGVVQRLPTRTTMAYFSRKNRHASPRVKYPKPSVKL